MRQEMTIQQALTQMIETERFKQMQRIEPGLRVYAGRIRKGEFRDGAAVELLKSFGFKVIVAGEEDAGKARK